MKTLSQIIDAVKLVREHNAAAKIHAAALENEISRIQNDGRTAEWLKTKTAEIRAKHTPGILSALAEVNKINNDLRQSMPLWENKSFLLSLHPVSARLNGQPLAPAADAGVEAMTRLAKMQEFALMPSELLHLHADEAKATKNYGALHLLMMENNGRDAKAPGFEPIGHEDVVLEDQRQAVNLAKEAKAIQLGLENAWRVAEGHKANPSDIITQARMLEEATK